MRISMRRLRGSFMPSPVAILRCVAPRPDVVMRRASTPSACSSAATASACSLRNLHALVLRKPRVGVAADLDERVVVMAQRHRQGLERVAAGAESAPLVIEDRIAAEVQHQRVARPSDRHAMQDAAQIVLHRIHVVARVAPRRTDAAGLAVARSGLGAGGGRRRTDRDAAPDCGRRWMAAWRQGR